MPKYDADTVARWKGSIAKWEGIVAGTQEDRGAEDCPLCKRFNIEDMPAVRLCAGCPVSDATDLRFCDGTPYRSFDKAWFAFRKKRAAQRMLDFLRGLVVEEG